MKILNKIKMFLHDKLGWGFPLSKINNGKIQSRYHCQFCLREITKDSQGNWFHLSSNKK